ncbi:MAG: alpha-hydroxy-acid oxidizing protein [Planctomycetes bacterium]|nr:alpha-hydroxy-acid oxidizing protein [Planctomycetota bacterium]
MNDLVNLLEYEERARQVLPRMVYDYFASGAGAELTVGANCSDFDRLRLRPRALVGVGNRDHSTTVFGQKIPSPIAVAPMAFQKLAHVDGEMASVRGSGTAGALFVASTMATYRMEEMAAAATGPIWFQLYVFKDRGLTRALVQRAETAGFTALQVTSDVPVMGLRETDMRNAFQVPPEFKIKNVESELPPSDAEMGDALYANCQFDVDLNWKDVEWLCGLTKLPVLVKGILRGDDAVRALDHGAKGVVVSNHGGRQLDTAISTIEALPEIVDAIGGRGEIVIDGGIRRGIDILKALALGATVAQVGRPVIWGLSLGGEDGVARALTLLRNEFDNVMAQCGCRTVKAITRDLVAR